MFYKAAGDDDNQLDEFEVMQLMKKLNNSVASMRVRQKFKVCKSLHSGKGQPKLKWSTTLHKRGMCSSALEVWTHDPKVMSSNPMRAPVLCPWARHFTLTCSSWPSVQMSTSLGREGAEDRRPSHSNIINWVVWPYH